MVPAGTGSPCQNFPRPGPRKDPNPPLELLTRHPRLSHWDIRTIQATNRLQIQRSFRQLT
jgi:hypothetical protein